MHAGHVGICVLSAVHRVVTTVGVLHKNVLVERGADGAEVAHRIGLTGLDQRRIAIQIEGFRVGLDFGDPVLEAVLRRRDGLEIHVREAFTTEVRRDTFKATFMVGNQVQLGLHARH